MYRIRDSNHSLCEVVHSRPSRRGHVPEISWFQLRSEHHSHTMRLCTVVRELLFNVGIMSICDILQHTSPNVILSLCCTKVPREFGFHSHSI